MKLATIFATVLLAGSTTATNLRRNRLYDVTPEFGRFDESDPAMASLFRELSQDDITMRFLSCMSYSMSMSMTSAPATAPVTTTTTTTSSTPAPFTAAPITPTSPSSSPAPINTSPGIPSTRTGGDPSNGLDEGCTFDATAFENDEKAEVLLKIDVETVSASTDFLDGLMDDALAALQEELGLCLPSGSSRTLTVSTRALADNDGITGVTLSNTEMPEGETCPPSVPDNTCHVVYTSVVVYGATKEAAEEGAGRVVAVLENEDFDDDVVVDVRVAERGDGSISNGVANNNNELGVEAGISSSSTGSATGLAVGLSVVGLILVATLAVVALSRRRPDDEEDVASIRKDFDVENDDDTEDDEETFVNPMLVPQPHDDATARSMRRMDTVEL